MHRKHPALNARSPTNSVPTEPIFMSYPEINIRGTMTVRVASILILLGIPPTLCRGHDQSVHMAISQSAAASSEGLPRFLNDTLGNADSLLVFNPGQFPAGGLTPISWITNGAYHEDDTPRFADHFYTVTPSR